MLEKMLRLRTEWQAAFPRQARGGVYALSGFDYQFGVFLLNLLENWSAAQRARIPISTPASFVESISDIAEQSNDGILHVTQVKLNATHFDKIFDEFWGIFNLAKHVLPGDESTLKFILCTSTGPVPDLHEKFRSWVIKEHKSGHQADQLQSLISSKHVSDPHDRILGILANDFNDTKPATHLFSWLGRLLAASSKADFDSAIKRIWDDVVKIANTKDTRRNPIYVWQETDRAPSQITKGDFLTGEQPRPFHLHKGFFSPRPAIYDSLAEKYSQWRQTYYGVGDRSLRLPVFWIAGRSGCGKSVALLHLMAHIHTHEDTHLLWIGRNVGLLPDAIQWATVLRENGREAIVGVDDPFAPANQDNAGVWRDALASLESIRCNGEITQMPMILCCGPTEHALKLKQSLPDDINMQIVPLPNEQQADLDELRTWYRQRTGTEAPDVGNENVLLVQLFFQWRRKITLPEFAQRFQDRINKVDPNGNLQNILSRVFAANRLYLGYPQNAFECRLSDELRDAVRQLKLEHHIDVMSMGRDGVWLDHPHLSNAIYESWYPADSTVHARETHLVDLINDALRYSESPREKTAPLWAIARSGGGHAEEEPSVGRLDIQTISAILPDVLLHRIDTSCGQLSVFELPVWIQLKATFPQIPFVHDPFDLALRKIKPESITDVGLRLTCHKLLEHRANLSSEQDAILANKFDLLLRETIHLWPEWPHVAVDAYKRMPNKNIESLLIDWIKRNATKRIAHIVIHDLLSISFKSTALDDIAAVALTEAADDSAIWPDIAKQIIMRNDSQNAAVQSVCKWAGLHCKEFRTGFLLAEMLRRNIPNALTWAFEWAARWHSDPSANWVLEALCETSNIDPRIRDWCLAWLSYDFQQSNPEFLAEKLIKACPGDQNIQQSVLLWLKQVSPSRASWFHVWNAAYADMPGNVQLKKLGVEALKKVRPYKYWLVFWRKLWTETGHDIDLISFGLCWLRKIPINKAIWIALWNILWHATNGNKELIEMGYEWLDGNVRHRAWGALWGRFWERQPGDKRLVSIARKWLIQNIWQWNVWFVVWEKIWKAEKKDKYIYQLAHDWLSRTRLDLPSWLVVWEIVWHHNGPADILRELGLKWLQNTSQDHGAWQRVWAYLWKDKKDDSVLQAMGHKWLDTVPMTHGSWPKMWKDLWPLDKGNVILAKRGLEWVSREKNFNHGDWQHNWKELVKSREHNDTLLSLGKKWLHVMPSYNNYWVDVWWFLSEHAPITPEMLDMARQWLHDTSPRGNNKWPKLWNRIIELRADDGVLQQKVKKYIATNPNDSEWYHLWVSLRKTDGDNKDMDEVGQRWLSHMLQKRPDTQSWHQVWAILWETGINREMLTSLSVCWLKRISPNNTEWDKVWCILETIQPGIDDIIETGREWLKQVKPHHHGWYRVWYALYQHNKDDKEFLQEAVTWLKNTPVWHEAWGDMWLKLYKNSEDRAALRTLALNWLAKTASRNKPPTCPTIWRCLWDCGISQDQLFIIGVEWLKVSHTNAEWSVVYDPLWNNAKDKTVLQELDSQRKQNLRINRNK